MIFVASGGKGEDESISEAEAMKKYLQDNDINEENIIVENKSINTFQNMKFSKEKIDRINKDGKIIFSTTNYHVFRSGVMKALIVKVWVVKPNGIFILMH